MKVEEVLNDYQFRNVNQARTILQDLGFKEEYHEGQFLFTSPEGEEVKISANEIAEKVTPEDIFEVSKEQQVAKIADNFDKDQIENYLQNGFDDPNISMVGWNSFSPDFRGAFSIVDHENKVAISGIELLSSAHENGLLLDGKGTKLDVGEMSQLMSTKDGRLFKLRRGKDKKMMAFYKKDALDIGDQFSGKKLSTLDKQRLLEGKIVPIKGYWQTDFYLRVDKELNLVSLMSNKEMPQIADRIGANNDLKYSGYQVSMEDKFLLANGEKIGPKLLANENGFLLADIKLSEKNELTFENAKEITVEKAQEILSGEKQEIEIPNELGGIKLSEDMKQSLKDGNVIYLEGLKFKSGGDKEINNYIHYDFEKKKLNFSLVNPKNSNDPILTNMEREGKNERNFDLELRTALEKNDFKKISELKNDGYKPSEEVIKELGKKLSSDKKIAFETIFGIKPEKKEDLKPEKKVGTEKAQEKEQEQGKGGKIAKAASTGIGKAFEGM